MNKPPTYREVCNYLNLLKMELEDKYFTLQAGEKVRLENEIQQWETIKNIHRQLL